MALRKLLTKRFFDGSKTTMPFNRTVVSSPPLQQAIAPLNAPPPSSADGGFLLRFLLLRRAVYHSGPAKLPEFLSLPVGEKLRERLQSIAGERRVSLSQEPVPSAGESVFGNGMSVNDARKILRATQMEKVKAKLRNVPECSVPYSDFLRICVEGCENREQGAEFAKILDESGNVIVLGNTVFLRPEQVAKSIESLIYHSIANPNDPRRKELEVMEKQKAMIDDKAKAQVRSELYFGLGILMVQTLGFIRLTFWELSWDVMEPICFFVTSFGFALAYLFFLKTSTEPTFQGFFYHRFKTKQERLMKTYNFDLRRYNEIFKACYPNYPVGATFESSPFFHHHHSGRHI
ncbi:hypothetical protein VNO78_28728 [Psophocarpus tetragonolobus]|uniref:Calcium uniporter protein C-terminal domain-containing protein n=1 Tax=Psophocarpus tetragonolobus TaxID=3891 RepID=A0AAN9RTS4_PSOTE